jgi:O-glycosyl hydrolase
MLMLHFIYVVAATSALATSIALAEDAPRDVEITFGPEERQVFQGFGASLSPNWSPAYANLPHERQAFLSDTMWSETGFNTLRIWFHLRHYSPERGERDYDRAMTESLRQQVRDAQERGVTKLVLAPNLVPRHLKETREFTRRDGRPYSMPMLIDEDAAVEHAAIIADFIAEARERDGLVFEATGVQNEPNTHHDLHIPPSEMPRTVRLLRAALDERGLHDVKVIAPESASADRQADLYFDALQADEEAWQALGGLSTHSYNMAVTERLARIALDAGKEYWQTESSMNGREEAGDAYRASVAATTVLSDLNHAVTHWIHFIAFARYDERDNATRIIAFDDQNTGDDWYTIFHKHGYYTQLAEAFIPGTALRKGRSSLDRSMLWTFGRKPRVVAAAGLRPDGAWTIGVSNFTSDEFPGHNDFWRQNAGHSAESFEVTLQIEELTGSGDVRFAVTRSGPGELQTPLDPIVANDGKLTLTIHPFELITLRAMSSGE